MSGKIFGQRATRLMREPCPLPSASSRAARLAVDPLLIPRQRQVAAATATEVVGIWWS